MVNKKGIASVGEWSEGQINLQVRVRPRIKGVLVEHQDGLLRQFGWKTSARELIEALLWESDTRSPEEIKELIERFRQVAAAGDAAAES